MKRKLLLACCALLIGWSYASAQEIGDQYVVGTSVYQITGANLITNGSFDDGVNGWYNGAWTENSIENSTVTNTGGYDDGAYITISAAGDGSTSTLRNVIPVESGKTYLFRCYTSGQIPSRGNIGYSGLWKGTGANGHTEGDQLYRLQWGERCAASTNSWTVNNYIFTPDEYTFVVIRSSWNANTKLDGFFIGEVSKVKDISETVSWGDWTGNANPNGAGQHWDGTNSTKYYDNASWWGSNTFEETQNVDLPAGAYVLKAAGRGAANDGTDAYISLDGNNLFFWSKGDTGKGIDTSGAENYSSDGTYANNNNGRGWEWRTLPLLLFEGKNGVTAKFGYRVNYSSNPSGSWSWAGICEPTLYKTELTTAMIVPDLRIAIAKGQKINDKNAGGSRAISDALSAAKAISLSSSVSDATTAYYALLAAIPIASDYAEKYALLDNEITKATAMDIASSDISTAEAVRDNSSSTADQLVAATQTLKVAEYNYVTTNYPYGVTLGEWTSTAVNTAAADFSTEHWSGETHSYKNQRDSWGDPKEGYAAASWSINFNQNVLLPVGTYVFKVAGRQASGNQVTTSLVVKKGEDVLGSVNDFPRSNSSRGIKKSGETAFEGENDDFANGGKGFGWEWRYVKFTLAEESTVNIAINAVATDYNQWVSFGDYTLQADNDDVVDILAYNVAKASAITVRDDAQYVNVTGSERTALVNAINADPTSDYPAATTALDNARVAFTGAKTSYDAYVLAKGYGDVINSTLLPYATTAKLTAVTTALSASVTNAEQAATAADNINTANRAAYESNMNAEGVDGAKDRTSLIKNADGAITAGWSGDFGTMSNEPYTEADGTAANTYFDKNGIKSFTSSQTIKLVAGTYILSVTARAQANIDSYKLKVENSSGDEESVNLTAMGNANGVFNRGWNVATVEFTQKAFGDATISIVADNTESNANFWMSWDRFRLVSIAKEGDYPVEITAAGWATLYTPYALDFSGVSGLTAYTAAVDGDNIVLTEVADVPANTGVVLKGAADTYDIPVIASSETAKGELTGNVSSATACPAPAGHTYYILTKDGDKAQFNPATSDEIAAGKAFLDVTTGGGIKVFNVIVDGSATGVEAPVAAEVAVEDGIYYNLNGQQVTKDYKGIVIVNGKKFYNK